MISTSLYPSVGTIVPYMKGNLDCLALFTTYPTRREFRCPLYRVLDTDSTTVTIVLRGALCLPLFGALSRTLSCSLSLSFSLTFSTALDSFYAFHMSIIFSHVTYLLSHAYDISHVNRYHMPTFYHMLLYLLRL